MSGPPESDGHASPPRIPGFSYLTDVSDFLRRMNRGQVDQNLAGLLGGPDAWIQSDAFKKARKAARDAENEGDEDKRQADPNPDPRLDACGRLLPAASRNYSVPPGYDKGPDPQNRFVLDSNERLVMYPYYNTALQGQDINGRGIAIDFGKIIVGTFIPLRKGEIVGFGLGMLIASSGGKTVYEVVAGKNSECSR